MSKPKKIEISGKKRLWVITELYYPEETSTGYYLTKIAEGLTDDFEVGVICGQPNYSARGLKAPKFEEHNGVKIFRGFGTTLDKNKIPFRLINMLTLGISVFFRALRSFRAGDLVLAVTTPPTMPFITTLASLIKGSSNILLIHDNYPEILIAVNKTKPQSAFVNFISFWNRWLYKNASKIIVVGRDMLELVRGKTRGLDVSIDVIPNWAELEIVEPRSKKGNELLKELGIEDKFVFLYAGNMGYPNDLESILESAEKLLEDPRFCFVFLGAGVKKTWLERQVKEKSLTNIKIIPPRSRSEQNIFLNACDVSLVTLVGQMWGVSMPSRTYNILAAGKPILAITEPNSELDLVVREEAIGWVVPAGNHPKLLETIEQIWSNRNTLDELGANARKAAVAKYSLKIALEKYRNSLKTINASDNE